MIGQGKYDDATATLAKFRVNPSREKRGPWDFLILETYGDVALAQSKKDDALARYQDAVTIDTHQSYIDRVNRKIQDLKSSRQRIPQ